MLELLWNAPVSVAKMSDILETLALQAQQRVLDIGCGCGEVLIRLHERFGIGGVGIDFSGASIQEAQRRAEQRVDRTLIRFSQGDARTVEIEAESFDLVLCLGSTHAFCLGDEAYTVALQRLQQWVRPGGKLLVGEPFLQRHAPPEFRAVIGEFPPDSRTHAANVILGRDLGLIPLAAWTSSVDEWDDFEWSFQRAVERQAAERPQDADVSQRLARRRQWIEAYLQWGRDTFGYGTYLFERARTISSPAPPPPISPAQTFDRV